MYTKYKEDFNMEIISKGLKKCYIMHSTTTTAGKENACKIEGKFINYNGWVGKIKKVGEN